MNLDKPLTDYSNALECLMYCQRAYGDTTYVTDKAHFNIIQLENCIVVAARGSWSVQDWKDDCQFPFIDTIYGQVHSGFWTSTNSILGDIHHALRDRPALPVVVTGHSLGGDQGIITALDLKTTSFPVDRVITFGAARPGGADFKSAYDRALGDRTCCWVDARDVVPRLPFVEMGYVGVGQQAFLPSAGGLIVNPTGWEMIHDDVLAIVHDPATFALNLVNDHSLTHYQDRIIALTR